MKTATTESPAAVIPIAAPDLPKIDPAKQKVQHAGHAFAEYVIFLPEGLNLDDLGKEPAVFSRIQGGRFPLRELDKLILIAHDRSWIAEARVAVSKPDGVVLFKLDKRDWPARYDTLPETNEYRVMHDAIGYRVQRKRDLAWVSQPVHSVTMAARDMDALYPRKQVA